MADQNVAQMPPSFAGPLQSRSLSRRQALEAVAIIAGSIYSVPVGATQYGRVMMLALDDVAEIVVRYRGRQVSVNPAEVIMALSGKG